MKRKRQVREMIKKREEKVNRREKEIKMMRGVGIRIKMVIRRAAKRKKGRVRGEARRKMSQEARAKIKVMPLKRKTRRRQKGVRTQNRRKKTKMIRREEGRAVRKKKLRIQLP